MKLATYRNLSPGATGDRLGAVLADGRTLDLRLAYANYLVEKEGEGRPYAMANARIPRDMRDFLCGGEPALAAAGAALSHAEAIIASGGDPAGPDGELAALKDRHVRLRAPIPRPGKFFHTGLNSNKHVANTGHAVPENVPGAPRFDTSLVGHEEAVLYPKQTKMLDYEVEVGIIIGKYCKDVKPEDAFNVIMGYTVLQRHHGARSAANPRPGRRVPGQELRHHQPHRPLHRHGGRGAEPRIAARAMPGERRDAPG